MLSLALPLGIYIFHVMAGTAGFWTRLGRPLENLIYRAMGVDPTADMTARRYAWSVISFSLVGLVALFALQLAQGHLPGKPQGLGPPSPDLAFNTAASFVTNTNWQAYAGETTLSYLTQALGLTVQNFVSAAVGIAVLFALIRGFVRRSDSSSPTPTAAGTDASRQGSRGPHRGRHGQPSADDSRERGQGPGPGRQSRAAEDGRPATVSPPGTLGNFWVDLTRVTLYVLLPLSLISAIVLLSQGVVQSLAPAQPFTTWSGESSTVPLGPAASQVAIKQLGTNGGGFFGANSAFPLENPTALSNFVEMLSLVLIPAALCFAFGRAVGDKRQGRSLLIVMLVLFVAALAGLTASEQLLGPAFAGVAPSGSLEGKEVVHGVGASSLWATATTAASNGSVNGMLDSFTALGGLVAMFLMQLGEVVFGGVGSGLYGMIAFVVLTVFLAGLMVGRTPEYLGKKIEPFDMRMVCLMILAPPLLTLLGTAAAVMMPGASGWVHNSGARGFSELLYAFTSMANNNGSAFAGLAADTPFTNIVGGLVMLAARFIPLVAALYLAGHLAGKKAVAAGEGTLSTTGGLFTGLLAGVIVVVGALSFLPALALGPLADFFTR